MLSPNIGLTNGKDALLVAADASANRSPVAASNARQAKIKTQEYLDRINQLVNDRGKQGNFLGELSMQIIILSIPRSVNIRFSERLGNVMRKSEGTT
jgi:hypothetical protein